AVVAVPFAPPDGLLEEVAGFLLGAVLDGDPACRDGGDALVDRVDPLVVRVVLADGVRVDRSFLQHQDPIGRNSRLARLDSGRDSDRAGPAADETEIHSAAMVTRRGSF